MAEPCGWPMAKSTPTPFVTVSGLDNPVGIVADSKGNVYVACDSNTGITGLEGPIGGAFTNNDTLYISNVAAPNVQVFPKGKTSPSQTIANGISSPTLGGFLKNGSRGKTSPYVTLTGFGNPLGIAASPPRSELASTYPRPNQRARGNPARSFYYS